jgi:hypothetical protein
MPSDDHLSVGVRPKPAGFQDRVRHRSNLPGPNSNGYRRLCYEPHFIGMVDVARFFRRQFE